MLGHLLGIQAGLNCVLGNPCWSCDNYNTVEIINIAFPLLVVVEQIKYIAILSLQYRSR